MKRYFKAMGLLMIVALLLALTVPAQATEVWKQKFSRFSATAGETVAIGDVVCIKSDGLAWKADANDSSLRPAVGVIGKGGAATATVEIVTEGILSGQTNQTPGIRLWLSETAGAFTATQPTNAQALGWVLPGTATLTSSENYYIKIVMPVSDGAAY